MKANDLVFLKLALKQAERAAAIGEVPVGAVLVYQGKVLFKAHNLREKNNDPLAHAEVLAIKKAAKKLNSWRLNGAVLYVTLEPCLMCLGAIQQARIARVVFAAEDRKMGAISLGYHAHSDVRTNHRFEVELAPLGEASTILSDFFKKRRNKNRV